MAIYERIEAHSVCDWTYRPRLKVRWSDSSISLSQVQFMVYCVFFIGVRRTAWLACLWPFLRVCHERISSRIHRISTLFIFFFLLSINNKNKLTILETVWISEVVGRVSVNVVMLSRLCRDTARFKVTSGLLLYRCGRIDEHGIVRLEKKVTTVMSGRLEIPLRVDLLHSSFYSRVWCTGVIRFGYICIRT